MLEKREGAEILDSELEEIEEEDDEMLGTIEVSFDIRQESQVGRVAVLLAATTSKTEEEYLKEQIKKLRWRAVATEVGGLVGNISGKLTRALVGAALNGNVIKKTGAEMHALMHASMEAINSFLPLCLLEASVGAKLAIVRSKRWIGVAIIGYSAYHAAAHHDRCGLGVMHI